jgi:hypothetical protein
MPSLVQWVLVFQGPYDPSLAPAHAMTYRRAARMGVAVHAAKDDKHLLVMSYPPPP